MPKLIEALSLLMGEHDRYPVSVGPRRLEVLTAAEISNALAQGTPGLYLSLGYAETPPPIRWRKDGVDYERPPGRGQLGAGRQGGKLYQSEVRSVHCHWVDVDIKPPPGMHLSGHMAARQNIAKLAGEIPCPPSAIAFSGLGFWAFWSLLGDPYDFTREDAPSAREAFRRQSMGLARDVGAWLAANRCVVDEGTSVDSSRVCPLFGSPKVYGKPIYGMAKFPTLVATLGEEVYTRAVLAAAYPPVKPAPVRQPARPLTLTEEGMRKASRLQRWALRQIAAGLPVAKKESWVEGNRHRSALSLCGKLKFLGFPAEFCRSVTFDRALAAGMEDSEVEKIVAWCERKGAGL